MGSHALDAGHAVCQVLVQMPSVLGRTGCVSQIGAQQATWHVACALQDLAKNRGDKQRRSKKDRSNLKTTFRDLLNTIEVRSLSSRLGRNFSDAHNTLMMMLCA